MKCTECGKKVKKGWNKCPYCGAILSDNQYDLNEDKDGEKDKTRNTMGLIGLVIGFFGTIIESPFVGYLGLLLCIIGLRKKHRRRGRFKMGLILPLLGIFFSLAAIGSGASDNPSVVDESGSAVASMDTKEQTEEESEESSVSVEETEKQTEEKQTEPATETKPTEPVKESEKTKQTSETKQTEPTTENSDNILEEYADYPIYSAPYVLYSIKANNMKVYFPDVRSKVSGIKENLVPVKTEIDGIINREYYYALTSQTDTDFRYAGETKDNRPNGYGILYKICPYLIIPTDDQQNADTESFYYMKIYEGEFVDGKFEGEGIKYYDCEEFGDNSIAIYDTLISERIYKEYDGDPQSLIYMCANPIEYIGNFEDGYFKGTGTAVVYSYSINIEKEEYEPHIGIFTGEYDNDKINGFGRIYVDGILGYEGQLKDDVYNGNGKLYSHDTGKLIYEGEFKDGEYNGYGTSYDKDGNITYTGEWRNGDWAN